MVEAVCKSNTYQDQNHSEPPRAARGAQDRNAALQFLKKLAPGESVAFQTFDDRPKKRKELAKVLFGTLAERWSELVRLNDLGAGVSVRVNRVANGCKAENVTGVRALFVDYDDMDGVGLDALQAVDLTPHIIVESSPRRYHAYYLLAKDFPLDEWPLYERALVEKCRGDLSATKTNTCLRVPGFFHQKGEPVMVRWVKINDHPAYDLSALKAALGTDVEALRDEAKARAERAGLAPGRRLAPEDITERHRAYAKAALEDEVEKLRASQVGERNDCLNRVAFSLGTLVGTGVLEREEVEDALTKAAQEAGLAGGEIEATLRSGLVAGMLAPRDLSHIGGGQGVLVVEGPRGRRQLLPASEGCRALRPFLQDRGYRFDATQKQWIVYKPRLGIWRRAADCENWNAIEELIHDEANGVGYSSKYVDDLLRFLRGKLAVPDTGLDRAEGLLPMQNGVLQLRDQVLLPHAPEHFFTWRLPFDFDPAADCAPVKAWMLAAVSGDESLVQILRAYLNAILTGRADLQRYLELIGPGGSGKGTFIRLAEALIGHENVYVTDFKNLEGNRFETAALYGKRLVTITDAEKWTGGVDTLKAITGQDSLRYEAKNKQQDGGCYRYKGMVLLAANQEVNSNDYTSGLQRRRITLRFDHPVARDKRRDLEAEFRPLLPGVLNWVLALDREEVTRLLRDTEKGSEAARRIARENLVNINPIAAWVDERVVLDPVARTFLGQNPKPEIYDLDHQSGLYVNYGHYCEEIGRRPLARNHFSNGLIDLLVHQLGVESIVRKRTNKCCYFEGLRLRTDADGATPTPITHHLPE